MSSPASSAPRHVVVLGGGVSGLAAAERLVRRDARLRVTVVEATDRLGGIVRTERVDGYVVEHGPDAVVAAKPAARELADRLGIGDRLHGFAPGVRGARVDRRGALRPIPPGLSGLLPTRLAPLATSGLLGPAGLLALALEPLRPPRAASDDDESVAAFVTRRLGRQAYERLTEPLLTGIFAGDGARLSIAATFPQLPALEREHGSVLRGLRRRAAGAPAGPHAPFLSFPTGMGELVDALAAALRATGRVTLRLGVAARAVRPTAGWGAAGARVWLDGDEALDADAVIVATPAPVAATLLAPVDAALGRDLAAIEHGSAAAVTLAHAVGDVPHPLDATGYVVPRIARSEGRPVLACTWASSKFAGRAPRGHALFRVFLGGAHHPAVVEHDDAALLALARAELRAVLGVVAPPRLARVTRWREAMPQYHVGHLARVARIERRAGALPWLALAGNAYRGVGIPDCIRSGERAADAVLAVSELPRMSCVSLGA